MRTSTAAPARSTAPIRKTFVIIKSLLASRRGTTWAGRSRGQLHAGKALQLSQRALVVGQLAVVLKLVIENGAEVGENSQEVRRTHLVGRHGGIQGQRRLRHQALGVELQQLLGSLSREILLLYLEVDFVLPILAALFRRRSLLARFRQLLALFT